MSCEKPKMIGPGCLGGMLVLAAATAAAQSPPQLDEVLARQTRTLDLTNQIDLAVPNSPAFSILGVTPEKVVNPASLRDLAAGVLQGLDENGNLQAGFALDFQPYMIARGDELTLYDYRSDRVTRWLANTGMSFAVTNGLDDEDESQRIALGIHVKSLGDNDPRLNDDLRNCQWQVQQELDTSLDNEDGQFDPDEFAADLEQEEAALREALKSRCVGVFGDWLKENWNASNWALGAAYYDLDAPETGESGFALWASKSIRHGDKGQFVLHARYSDDLLSPDEAATDGYEARDEYFLGLRYRYGSARRTFVLEAGYTDAENSAGDSDTSEQYLVGTEFKVGESIWFQLAYGRKHGDGGGDEEDLYSGSLKWGFRN